jgi:hypothetical protein
VKKRLAYSGGKLVAKQDEQCGCQQQAQPLLPVFFVNEDEQKTQIKRNPCPFIGIQIKKRIPESGFATVQKEEKALL